MSVLILIGLMLILAPIAWLLALGLSLTRRRRRAVADVAAARWQAGHYSTRGVTHVVVRLKTPARHQVLEQREIGVVADADPDYDRTFLSLISTAEERAALLRSVA
jgi:hypothetical protein